MLKNKGGLLIGHTDKNGGQGIPAITPSGPVILGGGEAIITEEATKKHCEELSRINQDGGGVPIPCGVDGNIDNKSKMESGGTIDSENKNESVITKKLIHDVISGKSKVRHGEAIKKAADYLRKGQSTSQVAQRTPEYKNQEKDFLIQYATDNNLWYPLDNESGNFDEGVEQKVYLIDKDYVIKINHSRFYESWLDYLYNLLLHNLFFPDTSYELIGFYEKNGKLYAAVKQIFVDANSITELNDVKKIMSENGFENVRRNDYYNTELGLTIEDLHEKNVLTQDGVLYFIDTVFFLDDETALESGGTIPKDTAKQKIIKYIKGLSKIETPTDPSKKYKVLAMYSSQAFNSLHNLLQHAHVVLPHIAMHLHLEKGGAIPENTVVLPSNIVDDIKKAVSEGYSTMQEVQATKEHKGIALVNSNNETNGVYPTEMKSVLEEIINSTRLEEGGTIEEKIENRIKGRQKGKEFKDTGVATYTRKYQAAYDIITFGDLLEIEKDNVAAYKLIEKSKIWPPYNVGELREQGNTSGAAYLKVKCREFLSSRPLDNKEAREVYVKNINKLMGRLELAKTVSGVSQMLTDFADLDQFDFGDISHFRKSHYISSMYTKNLATYDERQVTQYFDDIFGKKFYNFCKVKSDPARKILAEAVLYQEYTQAQRDELIEDAFKKTQAALSMYSGLAKKVTETDDTREAIEPLIKESGIHYYEYNFKKEYVLAYLNRYIDRFSKDTKESIAAGLSKAYVVRENDWSWSTPSEKKQSTETNHEGKPRKPQNIFEKYGVEEPKVLKRTPLEYIKRTGGLEVGDISTKSVIQNFGFKNIIYGNYVNDSESKEHTKHFLGSMIDLVEMLNIDVSDINKLGGLDINIGSTGCGPFSPASACYFPSLKAINLTKKRGDGSIAHEWGHYLDNVLAEGTEKRATKIQWATDASKDTVLRSQRVKSLFNEYTNWLFTGGKKRKVTVTYYPQKRFMYSIYKDTVKQAVEHVQGKYPRYADYKNFDTNDVVRYYGYLAYKLNNNQPIEVELETSATDFWVNSSKFSPTTYYLDPQELFARTFEKVVEYRLKEKGRVSNYLVDVRSGLGLLAAFLPESEWPYPFGEELVWLNDWLERLMSAIRVDYNIKAFAWNTKERVDEYTDYKDTKEAKVDAQVTVEKDEIIEGFGFKQAYVKGASGQNRLIYKLLTEPRNVGNDKALEGKETGIFIFSMSTFGLGKGNAIADGVKNKIPTVVKEDVGKMAQAKAAAIEYYKSIDFMTDEDAEHYKNPVNEYDTFIKNGGVYTEAKSITQTTEPMIAKIETSEIDPLIGKTVSPRLMPELIGIVGHKTDEGYYVKFTDGSDAYFRDADMLVVKEPLSEPLSQKQYTNLKSEILQELDIAKKQLADAGGKGKYHLENIENVLAKYFTEIVAPNPTELTEYIKLQEILPKGARRMAMEAGDYDYNQEFIKNLRENVWNLIPDNLRHHKLPKKVAYRPSHEDAGLHNIMKEFVGNDELRPVMGGIHFDKDGITSTDAYKLLFIHHESEIEPKNYCIAKNCLEADSKGEFGTMKYPQYKAVIPNHNKFVTIHTQSLIDFLETVNEVKYYNITTRVTFISFGDQEESSLPYTNGVIGFNANILLVAVKAMAKLGCEKIDIGWEAPHRPITLCESGKNEKVHGLKTNFTLVMPVHIEELPHGIMFFNAANECVATKGIEDKSCINPIALEKAETEKMVKKNEQILEEVNKKHEEIKHEISATKAADRLFAVNSKAWDDLKITSGGHLYQDKALQLRYKKYLDNTLVGVIKLLLSMKVHDILEDENAQSLNQYLYLSGAYGEEEKKKWFDTYMGYQARGIAVGNMIDPAPYMPEMQNVIELAREEEAIKKKISKLTKKTEETKKAIESHNTETSQVSGAIEMLAELLPTLKGKEKKEASEAIKMLKEMFEVQKMYTGGTIDDVTNIIISDKAPLSTTLQAITGNSYNMQDFTDLGDHVIEDKITKRKYRNYTVVEAKTLGIDGEQMPSEGAIHEFYELAKDETPQAAGQHYIEKDLLTQEVVNDLIEGYVAGVSESDQYKHMKKVLAFNPNEPIVNQYEGKTPEDVWDIWTKEQREHFIRDHFSTEDGPSTYGKDFDGDASINLPYQELHHRIKNELRNHVHEKQYDKGGVPSMEVGVPIYEWKEDMVNAFDTKAEAEKWIQEHKITGHEYSIFGVMVNGKMDYQVFERYQVVNREKKVLSLEEFRKLPVDWTDKRNYGKGIGMAYNPSIRWGKDRHESVSLGSHDYTTQARNDNSNDIHKELYQKYIQEVSKAYESGGLTKHPHHLFNLKNLIDSQIRKHKADPKYDEGGEEMNKVFNYFNSQVYVIDDNEKTFDYILGGTPVEILEYLKAEVEKEITKTPDMAKGGKINEYIVMCACEETGGLKQHKFRSKEKAEKFAKEVGSDVIPVERFRQGGYIHTKEDQKLLRAMTNDKLAWVYIENIGYDPFVEGATREDVLETLISYPEKLKINY